MAWGQKASFLESLKEDGVADPPALKCRPVLEDRDLFFWDAFGVLSPSRQVGMGVGAIPLTEIEAYTRIIQLDDPEEIHELIGHIRTMDSVYIEHVNKKK